MQKNKKKFLDEDDVDSPISKKKSKDSNFRIKDKKKLNSRKFIGRRNTAFTTKIKKQKIINRITL